jgi:hypothetical protein
MWTGVSTIPRLAAGRWTGRMTTKLTLALQDLLGRPATGLDSVRRSAAVEARS